ncbi:hypothetical protein C2845_PM06G32430 [Panicum miliaceum]|uniref:Ubiquitin-like protease family profile domain-containing protein n=1 Tax=Panicum miliaceum TaxID=4540 RepID=A0A3L6R8H6_PANMI|nr:hypothetical protein C2845_PM06G32430 [Panicum miliaceum]
MPAGRPILQNMLADGSTDLSSMQTKYWPLGTCEPIKAQPVPVISRDGCVEATTPSASGLPPEVALTYVQAERSSNALASPTRRRRAGCHGAWCTWWSAPPASAIRTASPRPSSTAGEMNRRIGLAGNLALFQVWFFEHFQAIGDGLDYAMHQHPLIRNWNEDKVLKRARIQALKKFGAEKVVIELEPNESKVHTGNANFYQDIGDDQYNDGMRYEKSKNKDWNENVEQEDVNREDLRATMEDDEIKIKMVVKLFDGTGSNRSTKCEGKQYDSSGTRKSRESNSNVEKKSEWGSHANNMDKTEKEKPCPEQGTAAEREVSSSNLSSGAKRKIDLVLSSTLVEKIIDSYATIFNSDWKKDTKVFIPMNTTNSHWWLCVLYPSRNEIQVLNSFNRTIDCKQETFELRCGIHSILQAILASSDKLESRWSNYDILNWDVVVKKNIPRQQDACSCGIFTIKYMQYWNGSEIANPFMQKDMETFRKKMPAELIMSALNELKSTKEHVLATQN